MKRVLITGANSYVGTNVERWLMREPDKYYVETLDMKDPNWMNFDFSSFDVVFHVAGIAHVTTKRSMKDIYFKVNRDLAIETAKIAKDSGVNQFIFMSSMIVYNSKETKITFDTKPNPDNFYGLSKLQAEQGILNLQTSNFKISILRPPMIYGSNSKGNFPKLINISKKTPIFPDIKNSRSMLFIDNLCVTVKHIINEDLSGTFFPQNKSYSCTTEIVRFFSTYYNRKIWFTKLINPFISILKKYTVTFNKLFSDSYYSREMTKPFENLNYSDLNDSLINMISNE